MQLGNGEVKKIDTTKNTDVMADPGTLDKDETGPGSSLDSILQKARIEAQIRSAGGSSGSPALQSFEANTLRRDVSWEKLLKKYMVACTQREKTMRIPNRKALAHKMYMSSYAPLEPDALEGVYVCIDTSGSVSTPELSDMLGIVANALKKYHMEGYVLYWDTEVNAIGEFNNIKELLAARKIAAGGGGTDPSCVFNYFDSKRCKKKPKIVLMLTDGYFFTDLTGVFKERNYGHVLWLITTGKSDYERFKAPFGIKARLKYDD